MSEQEHWHWQEKGTAWKGIGIYHVTLTIPSRQPLLGRLVIPNNDPTQARIERTELGEAITEEALRINRYYPEIRVIQHCLMPDHLHIIYYVTKPMAKGIKTVVRGLWQGVKKIGRAYTEAHLLTASPSVTPELNSGTIDGEKIVAKDSGTIDGEKIVAKDSGTIDGEKNYAYPLFTEIPFIRPMSHRGQLQTMIRYVQMNPQRLATKRLHPGFFRVQEGIEIAGRTYKGIGNIALLQFKAYATVHVRRTMVEEAEHGDNQRLRDYMNGCVVKARQGTIMISPFISPQEKQVMDVLLKEKRPFIYIADNGFGDYYKPQDSLFDAVADGWVLILSPWDYNKDKHHVSRAECVIMNQMADEIANCLTIVEDNTKIRAQICA